MYINIYIINILLRNPLSLVSVDAKFNSNC
jgi:hypothetical protein